MFYSDYPICANRRGYFDKKTFCLYKEKYFSVSIDFIFRSDST